MSVLTPRARALRQRQTAAEVLLWAELRGARLGVKFYRQKPIGRFIPDFVCFEHHLIVEADGAHHAHSTYDAERDAWLEGEGFRVLRFWNHDITNNLSGVLQTIKNALQ